MVTSALIPPAQVRPISVICFLIGCYLLGTGLFDRFVDHDTMEMFTREANADRFHAIVFFRIGLGIVLFALAGALLRLSRWREAD